MKKFATLLQIALFVLIAPVAFGEIKKGDKLQTIVNLHPDMNKRLVYSMNYQMPGLIPVCSDVTITKVKKKVIEFDWEGMGYILKWDKHTRSAGVSLMQVAEGFFGSECDKKKIDSMSEVDIQGIRLGQPKVGMSREGIHIAMGRPPYHANPSLSAYRYTFWLNRFKKKAVEFDENNKVINVRL
ncbi:MAG: hypothetical protein K6L76_03875 [Agarilytica sp.]